MIYTNFYLEHDKGLITKYAWLVQRNVFIHTKLYINDSALTVFIPILDLINEYININKYNKYINKF